MYPKQNVRGIFDGTGGPLKATKRETVEVG